MALSACWVELYRATVYSEATMAGTEQDAGANGPTPEATPAAPAGLGDFQHPVDAEEFRKMGYQVVDWIADYYKELASGSKPVRPDVKPGYLPPLLSSAAPEEPEPFNKVMEEFEQVLMPGVVHWQSPKFFAYFNAGSSYPGMLADMLMSATNMIGFSWAASPVSTELEMVMMDWLAQLMGLPSKFMFSSGGGGGGVIQGTSSEAVLVALLAARAHVMKNRPQEDVLKLVAYASDQAHSCFKKACMVAGIKHVRIIPTSLENDFALQAADLEEAMQKDEQQGLIPTYVCATIGTTSSCAVDPVADLAHVAHKHNAWLHVDAAYAGAAAVCEEHRTQWFGGLEHVDSYSFNPHKWLLTNFDCCAMWVADSVPLKEALSLTPIYLQGAGNALDYKDWQIPLGRRFRSLKLFFVLKMYGAQRLREFVSHHISLATHFASLVRAHPKLELAAPPRFGLVCFRLRSAPRQAQIDLLDTVNSAGHMFLTHTELAGQYTLRLAVGSPGTQLKHVMEAWDAVAAAADKVLSKYVPVSETDP